MIRLRTRGHVTRSSPTDQSECATGHAAGERKVKGCMPGDRAHPSARVGLIRVGDPSYVSSRDEPSIVTNPAHTFAPATPIWGGLLLELPLVAGICVAG